MLRVLTLSTLFPDASRPVFGVFVERQTLGLAAHPDVALRVVAPIGLPLGPFASHPHYAERAALPEREIWKGLTVHRPRFPVLPLIGARWSAALLARAVAPLLEEMRADFPFDVIDAEFFWPDGPAAARLAKRFGVPFSIKARGSDIHYWAHQPGCARRIARAAEAAGGLLAVSEALRQDMVALGMPGEAIGVHHTGVDLDRFVPVDRARAKAALGITGPLILSVGHLIARKGHGVVIEAMTHLPDATLLIAGEGEDRARLAAQIAALGLGGRVKLLGALPHEALPALLGAADVMALMSASEGLANVWVEALACGTPIVIPDVGGAREVIDRSAAGRIAERDPLATAAAISGVLATPPPQAEVREAAERFTWSANTQALYAHLSHVAGRD